MENKVQERVENIIMGVDYTKTVQQLIVEGKYDWVNNVIDIENFPISSEMIGKKEVSIKLFNFDCKISSEDAIFEMKKDGYRPANLIELLVLGSLFPELQRQFPIVALGSISQKIESEDDYVCCVPYLSANDSWREIFIHWFILDWDNRYRFLGVK